jgi:hypothetical protein
MTGYWGRKLLPGPAEANVRSSVAVARNPPVSFGQYLPDADLSLIAANTRRERLGGNVTCRKAVIRETADVQAFRLITNRAQLDGDRLVVKGAARD